MNKQRLFNRNFAFSLITYVIALPLSILLPLGLKVLQEPTVSRIIFIVFCMMWLAVEIISSVSKAIFYSLTNFLNFVYFIAIVQTCRALGISSRYREKRFTMPFVFCRMLPLSSER